MTQKNAGHNQKYDCEIKIKNHLDTHWNEWFDGLTVKNISDDAVMISGIITDQSALFGLFNKVRDLNLRLISLNAQARKEG